MHSRSPWDPFSYVAAQLESLVTSLARPATLPAGTRVLDFGCATQPYRRLFCDTVHYLGADLPGNPLAGAEIRPEGTLSLPGGSFDIVLSIQVLEHVVDPARYLSECYRLLEPGGCLVRSKHGIMYYHPDPEDYWRWTSAGLVKLVEDAGLRIEKVEGLLGLGTAALQLLHWATLGHIPRALRRPYTLAMQRLVAAFDRRYSDVSKTRNALVFGVRAVKPGPPANG